MRITLRQLAAFVAIADHGSMSQATETAALSQSALSMALQELEKRLDTRLFDRIGKRLQLNDNGRRLYPIARTLLDQAEEVEQLFVADNASQLHIGASTTIGSYLLPDLLAAFMRNHPGARVELAIENSQEVLDALVEFRIDVGFFEAPLLHPDLVVTPWIQDELVIFAASQHPLAQQQEPVPVATLAEAAWILREAGSGTREVLEQHLTPQVGMLQNAIELGNGEAIKRYVMQGLGVSCLSRRVIGEELAAGRLVELHTELGPISRWFYRAQHREKYISQGLHNFIAFCADYIEEDSQPKGTGASDLSL